MIQIPSTPVPNSLSYLQRLYPTSKLAKLDPLIVSHPSHNDLSFLLETSRSRRPDLRGWVQPTEPRKVQDESWISAVIVTLMRLLNFGKVPDKSPRRRGIKK